MPGCNLVAGALSEEQARSQGFISLSDWAELLGISNAAVIGRFYNRFGKAEQGLALHVEFLQGRKRRTRIFVFVCDRSLALMTRADSPKKAPAATCSDDVSPTEKLVTGAENRSRMKIVWNPDRGELTYIEHCLPRRSEVVEHGN